MGHVLKLDGLFAAVHFPTQGGGGEREEGRMEGVEEEGVAELLDSCRLLRKDDLVVSGAAGG